MESELCLPRSCWLYHCGVVPYTQAWEWQRALVRRRLSDLDGPEALLLLEHWPVYTLGQGATLDHVKFDPQAEPHILHRTERGGEVTYHCPGQVVGYPILNLRWFRQDLHWYLRQLEEVVLMTLRDYGLEGDRIPGLTGVWLEGYKVAAVGIKVSRWITMHGFALNVCPDLSGFSQIVPCGITDRPVGRLSDWVPTISVSEVKERLTANFAALFQVEWVEGPSLSELETLEPLDPNPERISTKAGTPPSV